MAGVYGMVMTIANERQLGTLSAVLATPRQPAGAGLRPRPAAGRQRPAGVRLRLRGGAAVAGLPPAGLRRIRAGARRGGPARQGHLGRLEPRLLPDAAVRRERAAGTPARLARRGGRGPAPHPRHPGRPPARRSARICPTSPACSAARPSSARPTPPSATGCCACSRSRAAAAPPSTRCNRQAYWVSFSFGRATDQAPDRCTSSPTQPQPTPCSHDRREAATVCRSLRRPRRRRRDDRRVAVTRDGCPDYRSVNPCSVRGSKCRRLRVTIGRPLAVADAAIQRSLAATGRPRLSVADRSRAYSTATSLSTETTANRAV
jgi:hypothetical protein